MRNEFFLLPINGFSNVLAITEMDPNSQGSRRGRGRRNRPLGWWDFGRNKRIQFSINFNIE